MIRRAIITEDKFRISAPGVDVDSAQDHQFILHEQHLAAQPYWSQWVACPFAGAGTGAQSATATIPPPPVILPDTTILLYAQGTSGLNYYPANIAPTGAFDSWYMEIQGNMVTKTDLSVYFEKQHSATAPRGAWVVYIRGVAQ